MTRHVPFQQLLLVRGRHQAGERAQPVLPSVSDLHSRRRRRRRSSRHGGSAVGHLDVRDRLAVLTEFERRDQRRENRRLRELPRFSRDDVREPDMRGIVTVNEEGNTRAVGRPRRVRDARAGRQLNRPPRAVRGGDDLEACAVADRQRTRAMRFEVDEHATELVKGFGERFHRHRAIADLVGEPLLVGTEIGEREIQIARRQDGIRQFLRRGGVAFLLDYLVDPRGAAVRRGRTLSDQRQGKTGEEQGRHDPENPCGNASCRARGRS